MKPLGGKNVPTPYIHLHCHPERCVPLTNSLQIPGQWQWNSYAFLRTFWAACARQLQEARLIQSQQCTALEAVVFTSRVSLLVRQHPPLCGMRSAQRGSPGLPRPPGFSQAHNINQDHPRRTQKCSVINPNTMSSARFLMAFRPIATK